jgi:prophage antirepressor-like protein
LSLWPFIFEGRDVRTAIDERDKTLWQHAGDVGEVLGLTNIHANLSSIKATWKRGIKTIDSTGRKQKQLFLRQQAVFKLAFRSRKPNAEAFTDRVAGPRAQGLLEHANHAQQKRNSKALNRSAYMQGGKEGAIHQNAHICRQLSDKHLYPSDYKEWAKELGYPAKDRTSGQQVLRIMEPWSACSCSLVKNLLQLGIPEQEAFIMAEQQKAFYARLLRYATPQELVGDEAAVSAPGADAAP